MQKITEFQMLAEFLTIFFYFSHKLLHLVVHAGRQALGTKISF